MCCIACLGCDGSELICSLGGLCAALHVLGVMIVILSAVLGLFAAPHALGVTIAILSAVLGLVCRNACLGCDGAGACCNKVSETDTPSTR